MDDGLPAARAMIRKLEYIFLYMSSPACRVVIARLPTPPTSYAFG
jgi:hypothetical protein